MINTLQRTTQKILKVKLQEYAYKTSVSNVKDAVQIKTILDYSAKSMFSDEATF
jgi:hypothetical protein